jgi:hypothetical protein
MSFDPVEADKNDPLSWTRDEFELPLRAESGGKGEFESVFKASLRSFLDRQRRTVRMA